jgi:drug/metabolite transporter superfamily protein YnfA
MSNEKQLERWGKLRRKGRFFFIAVYGFLWGVFMFALMCLFQFIFASDVEAFFGPLNLAVYGGVFLTVGFFWAAINWFVNERKFKHNNQDQND